MAERWRRFNDLNYSLLKRGKIDFASKMAPQGGYRDSARLLGALLCFINPRVRKIRNETSSFPGIFSRTLIFFYVTSSPGSPLPHLLDGHRKLVGSSAIPARSCPGPIQHHWGSIVELEVPPDETPGLMTLHPHNTNVLQSITYAKSPYSFDRTNLGQKN